MPSCQPCAERFTGARVVKTVTGVTRDLCVLTSTPSNERRERLLVWRFAWNRKWSQVRTFLWLGQSRLGACHNKVTRVDELSRAEYLQNKQETATRVIACIVWSMDPICWALWSLTTITPHCPAPALLLDHGSTDQQNICWCGCWRIWLTLLIIWDWAHHEIVCPGHHWSLSHDDPSPDHTELMTHDNSDKVGIG